MSDGIWTCDHCGAAVRFPHAELARVTCQQCGTRYVVGRSRHLGLPDDQAWVLAHDISGSETDRRVSDFDYGQKKADGQYERYPSSVLLGDDGKPAFKQPIRNKYLHTKCGAVTMMRGDDLCFTYATNPHYYSHTFCVGCRDHLPVAEFVWEPDHVPMNKVAGEPGKDLRR